MSARLLKAGGALARLDQAALLCVQTSGVGAAWRASGLAQAGADDAPTRGQSNHGFDQGRPARPEPSRRKALQAMVRDCPACDEIRAVELAAIFSGRSASSFEATQAAVSDIDADLGEVLRRDGIELVLGARATSARRDGEDYVLELDERPRAGGRIN